MSISPERRGTRPTKALNRVDLPAPFGPIMAACAPCGMVSVTDCSAGALTVIDADLPQFKKLLATRSSQRLDYLGHVPAHHLHVGGSTRPQRVRVKVGDHLDSGLGAHLLR